MAINTGAVIGPMLGGLVIATLGMEFTYLFNAISLLAVIAALFIIGFVTQDTKNSGGINLRATLEGVRFIGSRPIILSTMLLDFFATFFASANTMMPIVARDILKVGEVGYGWLVSAQSIGSVTAAAIVSQVANLRRQGPIILGAVFAFGAGTIVFGLVEAFLPAMLDLVAIGAADAVSAIIRNTIRQLQTPDHIRGQMTSINQIFFQGGPQLGELEAGLVGSLFGVPAAIISGGIGAILAVMFTMGKRPQWRKYNGDEQIMAGIPVD
ncbi:MAG: MFS transporter [Chloroflexi bacterium]|nr:MFS transporter [Chloroflexota bacterium]